MWKAISQLLEPLTIAYTLQLYLMRDFDAESPRIAILGLSSHQRGARASLC